MEKVFLFSPKVFGCQSISAWAVGARIIGIPEPLFRVRPNIYGQAAMACGRQAPIPMAWGRSTPLLSVP